MQIPTRPKNPNIRLAYQDKLEEREIWHKLVVKVIIWKDGSLAKEVAQSNKKITLKEWDVYCKRMIQMNVTYGRAKVLANLKETWQIIKKNGGFKDT